MHIFNAVYVYYKSQLSKRKFPMRDSIAVVGLV